MPDTTPPARRGPARLAWWLVRPVVRPLAHRVRRFLNTEIMTELADARHRQEATLQRLDILLQRQPAAPDPELAAALERVVLTLAIEDAARAAPPGLSNPDAAG